MNKIYSLLILFALTNNSFNAQVPLPYFTGFDALGGGWAQMRKGATTSTYSWVVSSLNAYSGGGCLQHYYPVGGSPLQDWYISPPFDFSAGGRIDSLRYMFAGFGMPNASDTVGIYILNGSADPNLAQRISIKDFRGTAYANDNVWRVLTNVPIPALPGLSRIAFKYETFQNWLDVHFDNLALSCNAPPSPTNTSTGANLSVCAGKSATLAAAVASGTINWYSSSTGTVSVGSGSMLVTPTLAVGTHTFYAETKACATSLSRTAITATAVNCTGLIEMQDGQLMTIHPNPVSDFVIVRSQAGASITLINALGDEVLKYIAKDESVKIDLSSVATGIYFIQVSSGNRKQSQRVVKVE
jgi:hypothetical protein